MSTLVTGAITFALGCYALASILVIVRLVRGPSAQDRVSALDLLYFHAMLVMLVLSIGHRNDVYFEAALLIALFGFVSSAALAKFVLRGEVIE
ncbi:multisubunit potassium/proton antiporter PhaF subunit [Panacagrimonas perspica]|uniref:Multisubunit potassium/proton antiporter PhaF subunit n=1 Tax=Panacagrimonas perspica TaxID=381431 RepID=A0A4S3K3A7_9GAMM|nr:K+/H+ antiporter subunit F [Panacagrimonas perspica]TDU23299.1 multisubunit potassium/proton antiporter PhaF subunit [Panacagrimonas perspica]THD02502.1 K+/H+ antiporter subunit F [Panacagrimonas perspica]